MKRAEYPELINVWGRIPLIFQPNRGLKNPCAIFLVPRWKFSTCLKSSWHQETRRLRSLSWKNSEYFCFLCHWKGKKRKAKPLEQLHCPVFPFPASFVTQPLVYKVWGSLRQFRGEMSARTWDVDNSDTHQRTCTAHKREHKTAHRRKTGASRNSRRRSRSHQHISAFGSKPARPSTPK